LDQYGESDCIFADAHLLLDWSNWHWVKAEFQLGIGDQFEFATGNLAETVNLVF
jgi:hypothetical protein